MFLARWNSARLCIAWVNGRLARMQRCDRVMGVRVSNSGSLCDPSLVSVIRKPKIPLLPLWEKGVGGMRGKNARECRKPLISPRNSTLESPRGRDARAPRRTARVMNEHWWIMQSVLRDLDMKNAILGIRKDEGCRHVRMPKTDHVFT